MASSYIPAAPGIQQIAAPAGFSGLSSGTGASATSGFQTGQTKRSTTDLGPGWEMTDPGWGMQRMYDGTWVRGRNEMTAMPPLYTYVGTSAAAAPASSAPAAGSTAQSGASGSGSFTPAGSVSGGTPSQTSGGITQPVLTGGYAAPTGVSAVTSSNPWSIAANSTAVNAGQAAGKQANSNFSQADAMRTGANALQSGASAVMNTGFDPQQDLYNRTLQQLQDQVRVGQAARGITMSPYGAGGEAAALSDFNIDWQNQQLNRQTQALGAAGTATNSAGTANTSGANIGNQGVQQTQAVGQLPYDQYAQDSATNIQNWIAFMNANAAAAGVAQQAYPQQLSQQSMINSGGVPYIPQTSNSFTFA